MPKHAMTPAMKAYARESYTKAQLPKKDAYCPYPRGSAEAQRWYREQIEELTDEFLADGGEITVLPAYDETPEAEQRKRFRPAHMSAFEGAR